MRRLVVEIKLSVIIVNYNTDQLLKDCLLSLQSILNNENFKSEIIVVDNHSKDRSVSMVKESFPDVIVIENDKDYGFSKANNQAIKKSRGEYILFLNPDTLVQDEKIFKVLFEQFDKDQKIGAVTCRVNLPTGKLDDACHRGFPTPLNAFFHFTGLSKIFPNNKFFSGYNMSYLNLNTTHEIDACCGAFMLVKRDIGDKVGWWDEDYPWYGEDLDLCYRLKELGYKIVFVPKVSIFHYKGASSGIKDNSFHISKADKETKKKAINARFDVMKIFYNKHYVNKYSSLLKILVFIAVEIKRRVALLTI